MKLIQSLVILLSMSQTLWAANGSLLIGVSPASNGMGGTGVGSTSSSFDAIHKNSALLSTQAFKESKINAEVITTIYKQAPTANITAAGGADSKSGVVLLPGVAVAYQLNESVTLGLAAGAHGGGVVDFSGLAANLGLSGIQDRHSLMKIQPAVAYRVNEWIRVGVSPIFNLNTLVTNENLAGTGQSVRTANGNVVMGGQIGVSVTPTKGLDIGVTYSVKPVANTHKGAINLSLLGPAAGVVATLNDIKVQQPTEIAAGVGYSVTDNWRVALDYRFIGWQGTAGYGDLGWKDQNVIALGTQYKLEKLAMRAGFNYGRSPVQSATGLNPAGTVNFQGTTIKQSSLDVLNLVAFPALSETHFTLGAGYAVTDSFDVDLAFMLSPSYTVNRAGAPLVAGGAPSYNFATTVKQWSVTAGASYRF